MRLHRGGTNAALKTIAKDGHPAPRNRRPEQVMNSGQPRTNAVAVRPLAARDRVAWEAMWRAYLAFYDTDVTPEIRDITFARLVASQGDGPHGLVAVAGDVPVGLVHYLYHAHCWRPEGVTYLQDLFVAPEARRRGVARALIEAVYRAADAAGRPAVYWMTQEHNHTARALYDRIAVKTPFIKYGRQA
jgi:GNAT superfamily N-acetyltransferase